MANQIKVKQVKGLQTSLDALIGIDKISETFTTTATDGDTGILISQSARETDAIQVFVNGQKLQEGYSWKKGGSAITASSLEANTELVWSSSTVGYDLDSLDEIQIEYETLTSGNASLSGGGSGISGTITGNLIPNTTEAYDLGSADKKFRDLYLSDSTIYMGGQPLSIVNGALTLNGNPVSGNIETLENHSVFSKFNRGLDITLPNEPQLDGNGNIISNNRFWRVSSSYLTLNPGDEVFDPYSFGNFSYNWNHSYTSFLSSFLEPDDTVPSNIMLSHNAGETLKYKTGSLKGLHSNMFGNNGIGGNQIDTAGSRIFVVGWENIDPTWPSTDLTQLPVQSVTISGGVVDQHIRCKLLDAHTINGDVEHVNVHKIQSDFIGQPDTNLDNYVAITVFSYNPNGTYAEDVSLLANISFALSRS